MEGLSGWGGCLHWRRAHGFCSSRPHHWPGPPPLTMDGWVDGAPRFLVPPARPGAPGTAPHCFALSPPRSSPTPLPPKPTSWELQGDTGRPPASVSPSPLHPRPCWWGEAWTLRGVLGDCGGAPGSASRPIPVLPPPCPSRVPNHFPAVWAAPSQRALIIDGLAAGLAVCWAEPAHPSESGGRLLSVSPLPGPWCRSHPRLKSGSYRPGRGAGRGRQRWSGSLVSSPCP